jgi:hypothetical protein
MSHEWLRIKDGKAVNVQPCILADANQVKILRPSSIIQIGTITYREGCVYICNFIIEPPPGVTAIEVR